MNTTEMPSVIRNEVPLRTTDVLSLSGFGNIPYLTSVGTAYVHKSWTSPLATRGWSPGSTSTCTRRTRRCWLSERFQDENWLGLIARVSAQEFLAPADQAWAGAPGGVTAPGLNPRVPALGAPALAAPGVLVGPLGEPPVVCAVAEVRVPKRTSTTGVILAFIHVLRRRISRSTATRGRCSTQPEVEVDG